MPTTSPTKINRSLFEDEYPFRSRYFMTNDGHRMHYIDEGEGEPILMVHGNPTWSFYFRNLVKELRKNFRCIVPDHIGCGLSDKPSAREYPYRLWRRVHDLDQLMGVLVPQIKINQIFHDWGGMIAMAWASQFPRRFRRIVVTNTSAFPPPKGKKIPFRLSLCRNFPMFSVPVIQGLNAFARCATYMASAKGLSKPAKKGLLAPYNSWNNRIATLKFVQDIPLKPTDPGFSIVHRTAKELCHFSNVSMRILWGKKDFVFDDDYLYEWQQHFPRAITHEFEDCGHYLLEDAPEETTRLISNFMNPRPIRS